MDYKDKILALSTISTRYNQSHNLYDSFIPVIEQVLSQYRKDHITIEQIQKQIEDQFLLSVPIQTIKTLIQYLIKKKKVRWKKHYYLIYHNKLELYNSDNSYDIDALAKKLVQFLKEKDIKITKTKAIELLCTFLYNNREQFLSFFLYTRSSFSSNIEYYNEIISFIDFIQTENQQEYITLKSIYMGAMVASLFELENNTLNEINKKNNMVDSVILDSNFVFKLFEFGTLTDLRSANETITLLKESGIEISVLSVTLEEIKSTINRFANFIKKNQRYISIIPQELKQEGGFLSSYIRRSLSYSFLITFSHDLESHIRNKGIKIIEYDIENDRLNKKDILELSELKKRIDGNEAKLRNRVIHDLKIVDYIKSVRKKKIFEFSKCKCIVVTSDHKLCYWNHKKHVEDASILECISDQQIVNLLWFNNPSILNNALPNIILSLTNYSHDDTDIINKLAYAFKVYTEKYKDDPRKLDLLSLLYTYTIDDINDLYKAEDDQELIDFIENSINQLKENEKQKRIDSLKQILDEKKKRLNEKIQTKKHLEPLKKELDKNIILNKLIFFCLLPLLFAILLIFKLTGIKIFNNTVDDILTYTTLIGSTIRPIINLFHGKKIELKNIWVNMEKAIRDRKNKKYGFNIIQDLTETEESINILDMEIKALEADLRKI